MNPTQSLKGAYVPLFLQLDNEAVQRGARAHMLKSQQSEFPA
jgi:hypothetical protein